MDDRAGRLLVGLCVAVCLGVQLAGCGIRAEAVPKGFSGDVCIVSDTVTQHSKTKADFFVLHEVNGQKIHESLFATRRVNADFLTFVRIPRIERNVPAGQVKLKLLGRTEYGAPLLNLGKPDNLVEAEINVVLAPYTSYVVRGEIRDGSYSAVWLEELRSGQRIGPRVEAFPKRN